MWPYHSKREKLACVADFARWKLGLLDDSLRVDYSKVRRVIFVCKGNICRSAYAEAKFNRLLSGAISAGTNADEQGFANLDATRVAAERGVDLTGHRTQRVAGLKSYPGDLFVCMEREHAKSVRSAIDMDAKQVLLIGGLVGLPRVIDPYGKSDVVFRGIFDRLDTLLDALVKNINVSKGLPQ